MKVFVYWNIRKKVWSIRCEEKGPQKGLVIAHRENLMLTDVRPKVGEAGRQRVLRHQQKNVHAGLMGQWDDNAKQYDVDGYRITYNPYRAPTFTFRGGDEEYEGSASAQLNGRRVTVSGLI